MPPKDLLSRHLDSLPLHRLGDERPAGLWTVSLPVPRNTDPATTRFALAGRGAYAKPLGHWHDVAAQEQSPRRVLLIGDAAGEAPADLALGRAEPTASRGDGNVPP